MWTPPSRKAVGVPNGKRWGATLAGRARCVCVCPGRQREEDSQGAQVWWKTLEYDMEIFPAETGVGDGLLGRMGR